MFSGIVDAAARVDQAEYAQGELTLDLKTGYADLALGESVAINGVCLTVTGADETSGTARFFISAETIARSNLGNLKVGDLVNTERAVKADTRLSGHLVQGHVDATGTIAAIKPQSEAHVIEIDLPASVARYCVEKGSVALDGISLTLNRVTDAPEGTTRISITIIPHTWEHTNLRAAAIGDAVNVEVDIIAKYVERLCQPYPVQ